MTALILVALLAQTPGPLPQATGADAHVVLGWQNLHQPQPVEHYNEWLNSILYAGAGAGWYWNDHLKTQIDFGAGTRGDQYRTRQLAVGALQAYESSRLSIAQQSVAVGQQYQFFRNQWFHPHIGVGADLARQSETEAFQPVIVYDSPVPRQILPARTDERHRLIARPFGEAGFKAYLTPRAFFTGDMRVMFRHGVDEVLFRAGFGIDF